MILSVYVCVFMCVWYMQSFTRDSVLYLVKQWLIELVEEVTGAHSPHNLTNDHAPDIEEQGRILMLD